MSLLVTMRTLQPPSHAWERIRLRLGLPDGSAQKITPVRFRAVAAAIVLLASFAALWHWRTTTLTHETEVATISTPTGAALWNVEVYGNAQGVASVSVRAGQSARPPDGRDFELWALPTAGAPVSLGVLPYQANDVHHSLSAGQRAALVSAAKLAVSVESVGGSPTGQPTGAVVYVVPLRRVGA